MRIVVTPEELQTMAQRFQQASGRIRQLSGQLRHVLQSSDFETRQTINVEGFVGAACTKAGALAEYSDGIARFLAHKAATFYQVDSTGAGELSEETRRLLEGPAPRPDRTVLIAAQAAAQRYLAAGGLLRDPRDGDGWSLTRLAKVVWNAGAEVLGQVGRVLSAIPHEIKDAINVVTGAFAISEGAVVFMASVALLATGPVGWVIGGVGMLLGAVMVAHGAGDVLEGLTSLATGGQWTWNPIKRLYQLFAGDDKLGEARYNTVGLASSFLTMNIPKLSKGLPRLGERIIDASVKRTAQAAEVVAARSARTAAAKASKEAARLYPHPHGNGFPPGMPQKTRDAITKSVRAERGRYVEAARDAARAEVKKQRIFNPGRYRYQPLERFKNLPIGKTRVKTGTAFESADLPLDTNETVASWKKYLTNKSGQADGGGTPSPAPS